LKKLAEKSKNKKALIGEDIDLNMFDQKDIDSTYSNSVDELSREEEKMINKVGVKSDLKGTAGSYIQIDQRKVIFNKLFKNVEILPIKNALKKYDWLKDYYWKAVKVDTDKYTSNVEIELHNGYFIRSHPGEKVTQPVQSCLMIKTGKIKQDIHNIIIAEENSELHVITGCVSPPNLEPALHIGVSEFYVKKNAKLTFTMIHRWSENSYVRPRSAIIVEEGGVFINNYVILGPVKDLQTYPKVYLRGKNAKAELYSVIYGAGSSTYDIGGKIILEEENTSGKVVSRAIADGESKIYARGELVGKASNSRAHLECNGLLLSEKAKLYAIPQLSAEVTGVDLSHEASVGKIQQEQLIYLMSRGLSEEEANSLVVRGFMTLRVPELPPNLQKTIDDAIKLTKLKGL
ncbi:MAG: SufB/SufD family protein, partial [Candidatus Odinarchaeia archaeon]